MMSFCLFNFFWEPVLTKRFWSLEEPGEKGAATMSVCLKYDSAPGLKRDKWRAHEATPQHFLSLVQRGKNWYQMSKKPSPALQ